MWKKNTTDGSREQSKIGSTLAMARAFCAVSVRAGDRNRGAAFRWSARKRYLVRDYAESCAFVVRNGERLAAGETRAFLEKTIRGAH